MPGLSTDLMLKPRESQLFASWSFTAVWPTLNGSEIDCIERYVPHVITGHAMRIARRQKDVEQSRREKALLLCPLVVKWCRD